MCIGSVSLETSNTNGLFPRVSTRECGPGDILTSNLWCPELLLYGTKPVIICSGSYRKLYTGLPWTHLHPPFPPQHQPPASQSLPGTFYCQWLYITENLDCKHPILIQTSACLAHSFKDLPPTILPCQQVLYSTEPTPFPWSLVSLKASFLL